MNEARPTSWVPRLVGALCALPALAGCPGTLSPELSAEASGAGASGAGGTTPTGGATGTGGTNCTGGNDGATLITKNCATGYCHDGVSVEAGLDLTVDANIGARLVGVLSQGTTANDSVCEGFPTPYLVPDQTPAQGLLINKITVKSPNNALLCSNGGVNGASMPYGSTQLLPAAQQACIEQWAEGLVMAAP